MAKPLISNKRIQIEKSKKTAFLVVSLAAVLIAFSIMGTKFLWDLRNHYNKVISEKKVALDTLETNIDNVELLTISFSEFENENDNITSQTVLDALPSKYDYPALVTSVEALANRSGMGVKSIVGQDLGDSAVNASPAPAPETISLRISVEGEYADLKAFLDNLELSIRPFSVIDIEIRGSDELINADLEIETYYQPSTDLQIQTETLMTHLDTGGLNLALRGRL